MAVYRIGVWRMAIRPRFLRAPLSVLYRWMFRRVRNVYGIEIPYTARVGQGVVIEHQSGIVVTHASVIGDQCIIRQGVTLGIKSVRQRQGAPVLGRSVEVGVGAVLIGDVRVGDEARIGANAAVVTDIPSGATAVGVPARVVGGR